MFEDGALPSASDIVHALSHSGRCQLASEFGESASIHDDVPLEILLDGMTFEVTSGSPGSGMETVDARGERWLQIRPGEHIAAGMHSLPVLRGWLEVGLELGSRLESIAGYGWPPADLIVPASVFHDEVKAWLEGGAFPIGTLVAITEIDDESALQSKGLAFVTGQELRLDLKGFAESNEGKRLALRIAAQLALHGALTQVEEVTGPDGRGLRLTPSDDGKLVQVSAY